MAGKVIALTLPWPPSTNHLYRPGAGGKGRYLKAGVLEYRKAVAWSVLAAGVRARDRMNEPIMFDALMTPPDLRRRDVDNVLKAMLDALKHAGVYADDSQIRRLCVEFTEPEAPGRAQVWITPWQRSPAPQSGATPPGSAPG